jgi:hypothetical protein
MRENKNCSRPCERAAINSPRYEAATRERVLKLAEASVAL